MTELSDRSINTLAPLLVSINTEISAQAAANMSLVQAYAKDVFNGGDPDKTPNDQAWYQDENEILRQYAHRIVNAYRATQGLEPNPYHPSFVQYKMFDRLLAARTENPEWGWVPAKVLSAIARGAQVETYLKRHKLKRAGWELEKASLGKVHYRIVKAEADGS